MKKGLGKAICSVLTSPYILKKSEKLAFGLPLMIHRIINRKKYEEWKSYKNKYDGKRCFIVGTGPSLKIEDLSKLTNEITFSVNSIINAYKLTDWRPTYYCITDPKVYARLEADLKPYSEITSFYPSNRIKSDFLSGPTFALNCSDMYKVKALDYFNFTKFGTNLEKQIYDGGTVVYAALQIAVYMGFKEVYLMGIDVNYGYLNNNHNALLEYNNKGYKYTDTKETGRIMIEAFKVAREYCVKNNIKVYNVNREGRLDLFQRIDLEEVIR